MLSAYLPAVLTVFSCMTVVFIVALSTFLLLRVSGGTVLERSLVDRGEGYGEYVTRTNAFIPWYLKTASTGESVGPRVGESS